MAIRVSAVILAGGQARRMGGADKGLQLWRGQPLFMQVYRRLQPQLQDIAINANRNPAQYAASGLRVFADRLAGFQGPLSGMLTALEQADSDFVLFVPCDSPCLPLNLLDKLKSAVEKQKVLAAYAWDGEREHPVFCLLSVQLKKALADYLARGERRILHFMREQNALAVDFSQEKEGFVNINSLQDLLE
ncbi:molybdenum cofactor guanylyltransferase [Mesocricetibacter intestinalis]|uniref:Molybdenum cofactor guanylyltransferase n=1 Tax=Mesocricetibacter intestinalis TaxID=1521930 RepID=A0A4R6V6U3_9PAST|nr:molybdenum cofactor guanylyltransferase MobA [Mesocricetibacter intestinalis]TDQ56380.1 molybdenum cofactor guanylyltransferase [Mesocricetibacter intestinalis]